MLGTVLTAFAATGLARIGSAQDESIQLLGSPEKLKFTRDENGVAVTIPGKETLNYAIALKIIPKA